MKLGYVALYVPDVAAAVDFYERAFGLSAHSVDASNEYAQMETGETSLVFVAERLVEEAGHTFRAHRPHKRPAAGEVGFVASDVAAAYATALKGGAVPYEAPRRRPDGRTVAYVRDLNGVLVEIGDAAAPHFDDAWRHALRG